MKKIGISIAVAVVAAIILTVGLLIASLKKLNSTECNLIDKFLLYLNLFNLVFILKSGY